MTSPPLPLAGIRVLDLTRLLPGNYCTLVMAALGADVIKVEDKGPGDYIRNYGTQVEGTGALHRIVNRGKRSICLDLKDSSDREVFDRLLATSDVLVESFRPGVLARLGYDAERLHALRPSLVICSISGFGSDGPLAQNPGHDLNFLALSGLLHHTGRAGEMAVPLPIPLADLLAGINAALFTIPFVTHSAATGVGAVIDTPMIESLALLPTSLMAELLAGKDVGGRGDFALGGGLATYAVYRLQDGEVAVVAQEKHFWDELVKLAGLEDLRHQQREPAAQPEIRARLAKFFEGLTREDIGKLTADRPGCITVVDSYRQMIDSDHAVSRNYVVQEPGEPLAMLQLPVTVDGHRLHTGRPAPSQGQHTQEILESLGLQENSKTDNGD
ncbi:Alpha-methylacyl-CoA racemase [Mycolicibacterium rhodesiae JS60]|nr:Alpha-methylacyl-CoA racemase [Mycolicibacterium rhodesiae JS60]